MMKVVRILLVILFVQFFNSAHSQNNAKIVSEIQQLMKLQEKAWNDFDIDGFMKYYWNNDSLMFVGSKSITYGWKHSLITKRITLAKNSWVCLLLQILNMRYLQKK